MSEENGEHVGASALLAFTAENVRSYRDEAHFSLEATRLAEEGVVRHLMAAGKDDPLAVLPAAGIFGANASGKSTLLRAMEDMRDVVTGSFRRGHRGTRLPRRPFLLDPVVAERPSRFEIELLLEGVRWKYGFSIDDERVLNEYAYHAPHGRPALVFKQEAGRKDFGARFRSSARVLRSISRENALLLSAAGAAGDDRLYPLFEWFSRNLLMAETDNREIRTAFTGRLVQSDAMRLRVLGLLKAADLGVTDVHVSSPDPETKERIEKATRILRGLEDDTPDDDDFFIPDLVELVHSTPDTGVVVDRSDESQGTLVWLGLVGPVLDALDSGVTLLVDELDTSLHPHLVQRIIGLFQSATTNRHCAQIIFNSHDTSVLGNSDERTLGRDQVWFTEKGLDGASVLYPLTDFKTRRDEALERRYLNGRYGGVPVLDHLEFEEVLEPTSHDERSE